ncbi:hypothetical protein FQA39_LY10109 [Lamprigera yunnana]|nr:hypothetical protein FQA39_LY10109 [Lamprigera yunnana]
MMEVDHISYIFGSFSRRRSHEVENLKRRSMEKPKISHDRSNSTPHSSKKVEIPLSRAKSMCTYKQDDDKFKCPLCKNFFDEPRVLPCLHTFCTKCLQELQRNGNDLKNKNDSNVSISSMNNQSRSKQDFGSGGSGYESDFQIPLMDENNLKTITCRICRNPTVLPAEGVLALPIHYVLQHRMVLATLNASSTKLLCDFCPNDVLADYRCFECAFNLCSMCADTHRSQKNSSDHEVLRLQDARRRGINRIRRQVMCLQHMDRELEIFCSTCCKVICRDCTSVLHKGHVCELASRAAKSFTSTMRKTLERVQNITKETTELSSRLKEDSTRVQNRCDRVREEVEKYINEYVRAIEEHRKNLYEQINQARIEKLQLIELQQMEIKKRLKDITEAVIFTDDLLTEATDVEILSFIKPIFSKLDKFSKLELFPDWQVPDNLQFLPNEVTQTTMENVCPIYGIVTTQTVSAQNCLLKQEGLENLRVGRKVKTVLETYDSKGDPLQRGGEVVTADLRYRDAGISRTLHVQIEDNRDGTYSISFTPDVAGKLLLSLFIKGQPIKDCPFLIVIRTLRPHHGTFHCCSFCSSGGSKEAACGCGGKMPGGYRGCGHGHDGHPGRRHWSCCGNVLEHSECIRANSTHYQFTL